MEAEIGVFGGSGFYSFLEDASSRDRHAVREAVRAVHDRRVGGKRVAFLPAPRSATTSCPRTRSPTGRTSGR